MITPSVGLNHLYLVLDDPTYQDIAISPFLHEEFAILEQKNTQADGASWSGMYLFGRQTYLELFSDRSARHSGELGLGLGVDHPEALAVIADRAEEAFHKPFALSRRHLTSEAMSVPWFDSVDLSPVLGLELLGLWVMAYLPEIFAHKRIGVPPTGKLTRTAFLAARNRTLPGRLMCDVVALVLRLDPQSAATLGIVLSICGFHALQQPKQMIFTGSDFTVVLLPDQRPIRYARVESLGFALHRAPDQTAELRLGPRSVLRLGGGCTAEWTFAGSKDEAWS